jgi:3-deoxy-manno-octulosonate cytidylyltransferase (CMP-KDO synthetase)
MVLNAATSKAMPRNPIVLIPARMKSERLPDKPLADIAGLPMIVHVVRRAQEADLGRVVVACAGQEIADAVRDHGGEAVLTDPAHPSGSDRIWEALCTLDPDGKHDAVVNIQGDLPVLDPVVPRAALALLDREEVDIGAPAALIVDEDDIANPSVTKPVVTWEADGSRGRALYFSRTTIPYGPGALFHFIGLYAYRRAALERFVALPPSTLELREKLEQLRPLEAGMRIDVARVDTVPLGVDTLADLEKARRILEKS